MQDQSDDSIIDYDGVTSTASVFHEVSDESRLQDRAHGKSYNDIVPPSASFQVLYDI